MKQDVSKILQRQLLLMGYNSTNTLSENIKNIFEQIPGTEMGNPFGLSPEDERKRSQENESKRYPNYCPYKEYAILPGEVKIVGEKGTSEVEGIDAIPKGESGETQFCAYRGGGNTLLYLPLFTKNMFFVKGIEDYSKMWNYARYGSETGLVVGTGGTETVKISGKNLSDEDKENYIEYLGSNFPIGTVLGFTINSTDYRGKRRRIQRGMNNSEVYFEFLGYYDWATKKYYEAPKLIEKREDWQIFVDEWWIWIQIGGAVVAAIIGSFFGATEAIILEIIVEGVLGGVAVYRDLQKGDNISAFFNVFFALCPWLKLSKWFKGVSDDVFKSLAQAFADSNLSKTSTLTEWVTFFGGLSEPQKELLSKFMNYDDLTKKQIIEEFAENLKAKNIDEVTSFLQAEGVIENLTDLARTNPELLKDLKWYQKLWAKELVLQLGVGAGLSFIANLCCSEKFNNSEKEKLTKLDSYIPESLKEEIAYNLLINAQKEAVNFLMQELENGNDIPENVNNMHEWWRYASQKSVEKTGVEYTFIDSTQLYGEQVWTLNDTLERLNNQELEKLKEDGYITYSKFLKNYEPTFIPLAPLRKVLNNDVLHYYVKVK